METTSRIETIYEETVFNKEVFLPTVEVKQTMTEWICNGKYLHNNIEMVLSVLLALVIIHSYWYRTECAWPKGN